MWVIYGRGARLARETIFEAEERFMLTAPSHLFSEQAGDLAEGEPQVGPALDTWDDSLAAEAPRL